VAQNAGNLDSAPFNRYYAVGFGWRTFPVLEVARVLMKPVHSITTIKVNDPTVIPIPPDIAGYTSPVASLAAPDGMLLVACDQEISYSLFVEDHPDRHFTNVDFLAHKRCCIYWNALRGLYLLFSFFSCPIVSARLIRVIRI
jgi:hypothetical protein